jgi:hypothetical protein
VLVTNTIKLHQCVRESIFSIFSDDFSFNDGKTFFSSSLLVCRFFSQLTMTKSSSTSKKESVCAPPQCIGDIFRFRFFPFSFFMLAVRAHKIQLWLSTKSRGRNKKNERRFFFVYSIFNPPKKKNKRKKRFGNNKKNGIGKFGKNCHLPRLSIITTTNMCIWIFSYMLDGFLLYAELSMLLSDGKKKQQKEEA